MKNLNKPIKLHYLQESDFWKDLELKNLNLVKHVVEHIITAIENESKKHKINIFEIDIADEYILDFAIEKKEYFNVLENLLPDLIIYEEYELCSKIKMICGL